MEERIKKQNLPSLARVIIYNDQGQVLLVQDKKWGWNHPGGRIEKGETPEVAAQREVQEETGLIIKNLKKIGEEIIFFASLPPGNQDWKCYFYQTKEYEGRIKNREPEKILDIKFVNWNSPETKEARQSYQQFFRKYQGYDK